MLGRRPPRDDEAGVREAPRNLPHRALGRVEDQDALEGPFREIVRDRYAFVEARVIEVSSGDLPQFRVDLREGHVSSLHGLGDERGGVARAPADDSDVQLRSEVEELKERDEGRRRREDGPAKVRMEWDRRVRIRETPELRRKPLLQVERAQGPLDGGAGQEAAVAKGGHKVLAPAHALPESVSRV